MRCLAQTRPELEKVFTVLISLHGDKQNFVMKKASVMVFVSHKPIRRGCGRFGFENKTQCHPAADKGLCCAALK